MAERLEAFRLFSLAKQTLFAQNQTSGRSDLANERVDRGLVRLHVRRQSQARIVAPAVAALDRFQSPVQQDRCRFIRQFAEFAIAAFRDRFIEAGKLPLIARGKPRHRTLTGEDPTPDRLVEIAR